MLLEVAVGFYTGSLALLADAGHMLADTGALALALVAQRIAARGPQGQATFGYRRAEVLAAFVNGIALAMISGWIAWEAVHRLSAPRELRVDGWLETAVAGLGVNLAVAFVLSRSSSRSVNVRAALAHVMVDALGSVSAIIAAAAARFWGVYAVDNWLSILIAALVARSGWMILRETTAVLLESAPGEHDTRALAETIATTPGVSSFHDLHAWRISDGFDAVTVHVVLAAGHHGVEVCANVGRRIEQVHGIRHVTVQPEAPAPQPIVPLGLGPRSDVSS